MLVSRKNLSLIHFVAGKSAPSPDMSKTLHQRVVLLVAPGLGGELLEPFAKSSIQRLTPSASDGSGPFRRSDCEPSLR
jgi:hypothetical protein